ncbi:unnamed protein product [Cylindrotheca closterium]|uniref:Uncharacterized protein n=1 Tax=Cylindrotheca closterium TaxID=2856 RepID=A0AAD2G0E9_9STRA|nr:unnamed protein product [Cylindrotheca closterium]
MHHSHSIRQPFQLLLIGSTLLGQSIRRVQASAADGGTAAHQTAQVEIDANGKVYSSTTTTTTATSGASTTSGSSSFSSLDSSINYLPGVDHSWPTHHHDSEHFPEYRKEAYLNYVGGCNQQIQTTYSVENANYYYNNRVNQRERFTCYKYEQDRMDMNLNQPRMMENYTHAGFAKLDIPQNVQTILQDFWEANKDWETQAKNEVWDPSNTYVNHWESPTKILDLTSTSVNNPLSPKQKWELVRGVQKVLEAWTKSPLVLTSLYGIRIYQEGSILAPHVDRLPLVSSAILHIASSFDPNDKDEEEPWILEVIGHNGQAQNLTMQPGEMVLYESHSVIHGRPYPLKGKFYANLFVHFEPLGHTLRHAQTQGEYDLEDVEMEAPTMAASERVAANAKAAYERAFQMEQQMHAEGRENKKKRRSCEMPHYVDPDKEARWKQLFDYDKKPKVTPKPMRQVLVSVTPHNAAAGGNLDALKTLADVDRANLFKRDQNGWRPLHEAARSGHVEVVEYLLQEGAKVNERTNNGEGGTPLWWAEKKPEKNKEAIELLKKYGGLSLQPKVLDEKEKKDQQKGNEDDVVARQA